MRLRSRRPTLRRPDPVVADLLSRAEAEAIALRHDAIAREHVLVALGAATRAQLAAVRVAGPPSRFDADALQAIGIDLEAVRRRVDAVFGEGALERARCGFAMEPRLKRALEQASLRADATGRRVTDGDILAAIRADPGPIAAQLLAPRQP
jgi:ATP-dependent Clp protease ATP-binding subunit ClpA